MLLDDFTSILAVFWLSWNPLVLTYANDGNSHASELLLIVAGSWGLLSSMRNQSGWPAAIGALCLGYAGTIRYSEILLLLPVLFVVAVNLLSSSPLDRRRFANATVVLIGWSIPIALLASFCWCAFGAPWRTGYSYCAEDSGFGWKYFIGDPLTHRPGNWETLVVQLNWIGLLMLWPVGLVGMFTLIGVRWREGVFVGLWCIPPAALYLCYYWAPSGESNVGYLRFFIAVIPALILTGMWLIERGVRGAGTTGRVSLGLITALGVSVNLWNTLPSLEASLAGRQALAQVSRFVDRYVPKGSSLFIADEGLCNSLDAAGGYSLYNLKLFKNASFTAFERVMDDPTKASEPDPRQRSRIELYRNLTGAQTAGGDFIPKSNEQLNQAQNELIDQILGSNNRAFVLLCTAQISICFPIKRNGNRSISGAKCVIRADGMSLVRSAA
jgi:hypothetical protein